MRQHVVHSCENLPDAEKQRVQAIQSQKDAAAELKKRNKRSVYDGLGNSPLMGNNNAGLPGGDPSNRAGAGDNGLNGSFGDMFSRLSGTHPHGGSANDAAFFSYSALGAPGGGGPDASTSAAAAGGGPAGGSGLPASAPTGAGGLDKQDLSYSNSKGGNTSNSNKKRRKKEDSTSASGIGNNWHLGSFLNLP